MIAGWTVVVAAVAYLCMLFAIAHWGDRGGRRWLTGRSRSTVYALTLAVYCTSWTFFGSVGLATRTGLDFLAIYVGPLLVVGLGYPFLMRIVRIAKAQNITSIADFIAARYGKSERVAALVALIAVIGAVPYIALQLKAVSSSLTTFLIAADVGRLATAPPFIGDLALLVALILAAFAVAFGTRHIDATEHHDGLMLAIATESVVKLVAFLAVGLWAVYGLFDGFADLFKKAAAHPNLLAHTNSITDAGTFVTMTVLSAFAILLLPRQFHVMVVENRDEGDIPRAAWMFPLYLVAINLFVVPLAVTGSLLFPDGAIDRDMTVLALPLAAGANGIALLTFIGGLSAATAMVIVASVALAIMVSNHLVMPVALRWRRLQASRLTASEEIAPGADMGGLVLFVRRVSIVSIVLLGYLYYRAAGSAALAAIGLLSFAAVAQIAPAFFAGLVWRRGTALGAGAGLLAGLACWAYTLLLPTLAEAAPVFATTLEHGPFGITALKPTALFGLELPRLTHGVVVSLGVNLVAYVVFSLLRPAEPMERLQASAFVDPSGTPMAPAFRPRRLPVTVEELRNAVARYLGSERAMSSFDSFAASRGLTLDLRGQADPHLLRYAEHLLSSAIGAASARLVLSLLLKRGNVSGAAALKLLDDASAALQYDRDLLQNALDHARQGISLFDRHLRLLAWNRAFVRLYDLPDGFVRVGLGLDEIVRFNAERGLYGEGDREEIVSTRLESFVNETRPVRLRLPTLAKVIEIRSSPLPEGGVVTTYTDITQEVEAEEALARANETLEGRVRERTRELERLNRELSRAKSAAEEANTSKTRFLAAASHDILQPLNAARLYATALADKTEAGPLAGLARNVDGSLEAVEEILGALLDISRLDAGAMKPEFTSFRIDDILAQLKLEFAPLAREKGLDLRFVSSSLSVRSDRRLLRRLLQNLVSNAIKYTPRGKVLVGCRRQRGKVVVEVRDTGVGIPGSKQKLVFQEFQRLDEGARVARGLGLGLSIVERIARVVGAPVRLSSEVGRGSAFSVMLPLAAALPEATSQRETAADTAGSLAGTIVLAIDNEPAILDGMRTLLNGWGCEVLTAAGLKEAVQLLRRRKVVPHLMIADYHLDDGDGIEAVVALRWRIGRDAPAILATADRSVEVRDKAADAGIDVLHKPIRPAALRALIARKRSLLAAAE